MSTAANSRSNWRICECICAAYLSAHVDSVHGSARAAEFVAHAQDVTCASLSPSNARTLVTGGEDRRVNLWIIGQPKAITVGITQCRQSIALINGICYTGIYIQSISGLSSPVGSVIFNNTEDCIAAGSISGTIKIFDLNENKGIRNHTPCIYR